MSRSFLLSLTLTLTLVMIPHCAVASPHISPRLAYQARHVAPGKTHFQGSIRFTTKPAPEDFDRLRRLGVSFLEEPDRSPLGSSTVFPARIPFTALSDLKEHEGLASVEPCWRPGLRPQLASARPQMQADQAWSVASPLGGGLGGRGVTIADFDTGVNQFHSQFFALSGDEYAWLDMNSNGEPDAGDGVDLDGDGLLGTGEALATWEVLKTHTLGNDALRFDTDFDLLFNDANGNGVRDSGPPLFNEDSPCFGELLFLADDVDGDTYLDPAEHLLALGSSRIRSMLHHDGSVYRRGDNLMAAPGDTWGHGTMVSGILGGGWQCRHAAAGVAPEAELIHIIQDVDDNFTPVEWGLAWGVAEGADVFLFEFGSWIWEYLDGSSNLEIMINEYSAENGVIIVIPAGNLRSGSLHCRFPGNQEQALDDCSRYSEIWCTFLWTDPVALDLTLIPQFSIPRALPLDGSTIDHEGTLVYSNFSISPRGTRRIDLHLARSPGKRQLADSFILDFSGSSTQIHGFMADENWGFGSRAEWREGTDESYTVCWPATADSGLVVGSYDNTTDGDIMYYSSRGPRLDGRALLDIAAPGALVYAPSPYNDFNFTEFGGTSAATPFVAGAAALLKELIPDLDGARFRKAMAAGAGHDQHTGITTLWGAGKLRLGDALVGLLSAAAEAPPAAALSLRINPNPANPRTTIGFRQDREGPASLRIFDLHGAEVWNREMPPSPPGWRQVAWSGRSVDGRPVASGIYLVHVRQGDRVGVGKLAIIK